MQIIGVISDTHIPDRKSNLPQQAIDIFTNANVSAIIHAGDISLPRVLKQLEEIAPVFAVRGNRDLLFGTTLPKNRIIEFDKFRIGISHGHGNWSEYLTDKIDFLIHGPGPFQNIEDRMIALFPDTHVVLFGHTHAPLNRRLENGQLLFNPGSPSFPNDFISNLLPSVGLLYIDENHVKGEIKYFKSLQ